MARKPKFRFQRKSPNNIRWRGMAWVTNNKKEALAEVKNIYKIGNPQEERVYSYELRRPLTMEDVA